MQVRYNEIPTTSPSQDPKHTDMQMQYVQWRLVKYNASTCHASEMQCKRSEMRMW